MMRPVNVTAVAAFFCIAIALGPHVACAQSSDTEGVKAAVNNFFAAASSREMARMEALWVLEPNVVLVLPPDKTPSIGWEAAKKDWQARFNSVAEWNVSAKEAPNIQIFPGLATTTTVVSIQAKTKAGAPQNYSVLLTQVFVKRGDRWLLVANHGSRAPE